MPKSILMKDEVSVLKSVMMRLSDDVGMLVTYQYHAEKNDLAKFNRDRSLYRYVVRVFKDEDLKKAIEDLRSDEKRLNRYKWPNDPLDVYIVKNGSDCLAISEWLERSYKKIYPYEKGMQILEGWKFTAKNPKGTFNGKNAYAIDGYKTEDGNLVSLKDKDKLLEQVGKNLIYTVMSKKKQSSLTSQLLKT